MEDTYIPWWIPADDPRRKPPIVLHPAPMVPHPVPVHVPVAPAVRPAPPAIVED